MNFLSPGRSVIPFRLALCCAWCYNFLTLVPRQTSFGTAPFYVRLILQCELLGPRRRSRFYNLTALCWPASFPFATRRNGRSKAAKTSTAQRSIHSRQPHVSIMDLSILSFQCHSQEGGPPFAMSVPLVRSILEPEGWKTVCTSRWKIQHTLELLVGFLFFLAWSQEETESPNLKLDNFEDSKLSSYEKM